MNRMIPVEAPTYRGEEHDQMQQLSWNMVVQELWGHNMPVYTTLYLESLLQLYILKKMITLTLCRILMFKQLYSDKGRVCAVGEKPAWLPNQDRHERWADPEI